MNTALTEYKQWLESLKPGDKVAVHDAGWGSHDLYRILPVTKVTKTQIEVNYSVQRFWRKNGEAIGSTDSYRPRASLEVVTDDICARIRHEQNLRIVKAVNWKRAPADLVAAVVLLVTEARKAGVKLWGE